MVAIVTVHPLLGVAFLAGVLEEHLFFLGLDDLGEAKLGRVVLLGVFLVRSGRQPLPFVAHVVGTVGIVEQFADLGDLAHH